MKKLINEKTHFLADMLQGISIANPQLEIKDETIVVKKNKKEKGVAIVSGGGSGHEPAHAGYVAEGMLDAAVCGEVFTSPTPDKIISAIKAVDNGDGVLLVVKNYAGDVMNFEMAQEMAEMEDIKVATVIVRDDIAVADTEKRRGVAGTVFVHKIAGYLADEGYTLDEIQSRVEHYLRQIKSIGMALTAPMVPTTGQYGFDIDEDEMEIGIGIHGERGISRTKIQTVDQIVEQLIEALQQEVSANKLIVMVNGMGGTPQSELSIAVKYIAQVFKQQNIEVAHWFVGDFMTSLDMQGLSVTLMPYEETLSKALTAPTASPYFN